MSDSLPQGADRRISKRIKKAFTTRIRIYGQPFGSDWNIVIARNVSAGGALFIYDSKIPAGTRLNMKINFLLAADPIQCFGRVLRCTPISASFCEVAVAFDEIDGQDARVINQAAEDIYKVQVPNRIASYATN